MIDYLEKNKDVGILGGKVYYKDRPNKLTDSALNYNFYLGTLKKPKSKKEIAYLQSCSIMIPREVFKKIGLFDDGFYPLYFDDFDLSLRAKSANFKIRYLKKAVFWHGCGKTTEKAPNNKRYYWWYRNKIRFMIKNASPLQTFSFLTFQLITVGIKSIFERKNLLPIIAAALIENLKLYQKTVKSRKMDFKNGFR